MRFTLSKLFLAVTLAALACAGATFCTRWWAHGIFIFTVLMYVFAAIRAIAHDGRSRATSAAFALVGGSYLLLAVCSAFSPVRDLLLTNQAIIAVGKLRPLSPKMVIVDFKNSIGGRVHHMGPEEDMEKNIPQGSTILAISPLASDVWPDEFTTNWKMHLLVPEHAFLLIGHCVFSWIFALLAAWLAVAMYAKREKQKGV